MRRSVVLIAVSLVVLLLISPARAGSGDGRIDLPDGFQPEGIAIDGNQFYVGSIPTGAIYRGDLRTGNGQVLVARGSGRSAIGLEVRRGLVFVAGGETGKAFVYSAATGGMEAELTLTTATTFINDVVVTRQAAWFTDSLNPVLYRVPLTRDGEPAGQSVDTVRLTGDFQLQEGFNTNGIDATPDDKKLVIVQSNTGLLFTVDPTSGDTGTIDLDGATVRNGDGILLQGRRLYVVQNRDNQIAVIRLNGQLAGGNVIRRITDPSFDVPTTIAGRGPWLYAVNARFGTEPSAETDYWISRVRR